MTSTFPTGTTFAVEGGADLTVGLVLPDTASPPTVQRFVAGELMEWSEGDPQAADVVVTVPGVDEVGFCRAAAGSPEGRGEPASAEALGRARVGVRTADGSTREMAMPPFDIVERGSLDALPVIPKLDVRVEFRYHGTPFGDVATAADVEEGRVVRWEAGPQDEPEVALGLDWTRNLDYRAGRIRPEDMLAGDITGDRHRLMAMFGLLISEEWIAAVALDGAVADVLIRFGSLWGSDAARVFFAAGGGVAGTDGP